MLEALACGTPVIATETAGGSEVHMHFPHDVTLAPIEDPAALAAAVATGLNRGVRVGAPALDRLRHEFSTSACATAYLDLYRLAVRAH
jgi:glycosyltransferase involved in cell wall biosynthesis